MKANAEAIHICNSHRLTHRPKIAKEYVSQRAERQTEENQCTTRNIKNWAECTNFEVYYFNLVV